MKFPIEYGHRQLNIFYVPLVEIFEDGFNYKGKKYLWSDVKDIIIRDPKLGALWGYPSGLSRATITLSDKRKIRITGRILIKKGQKPKINFLSSKSDAFDELIGLFRANST